MSSRYYIFDNIKVLLIALVVFGHIIEPQITNGVFGKIFFSIYIFHMPIFVLITGYFMDLKKDTTLSYLKIYAAFQIIYTLASLIRNGVPTDLGNLVQRFMLKPTWILWYILSLVLWKILLGLFDKKALLRGVIIGLVIGYNFLNLDFYVLSIGRTLSYFPFILVGYYFKRSGKSLDSIKLSSLALFCALLVIAVTFIGLSGIFSPILLFGSYSVANLYSNLLVVLIFKYYFQVVALIVFLVLITVIPDKQFKFSIIGQQTLPIYLYHGLLIYALNMVGFFGYIEPLGTILSLIVDILLTILIIIILKNRKVISL